MSSNPLFETLLTSLIRECQNHWGVTLNGILLFGSTIVQLKVSTDIDLMICVEDLPIKRRARLDLFDPIERSLQSNLNELRGAGHALEFSVKLRTPDELFKFSPLYLDFPDRSRILFEKEQIFTKLLIKTKDWIQSSGARKVAHGLKWYWILNPNASFSDEFEIGW